MITWKPYSRLKNIKIHIPVRSSFKSFQIYTTSGFFNATEFQDNFHIDIYKYTIRKSMYVLANMHEQISKFIFWRFLEALLIPVIGKLQLCCSMGHEPVLINEPGNKEIAEQKQNQNTDKTDLCVKFVYLLKTANES